MFLMNMKKDNLKIARVNKVNKFIFNETKIKSLA